jgi:hypothetical protein
LLSTWRIRFLLAPWFAVTICSMNRMATPPGATSRPHMTGERRHGGMVKPIWPRARGYQSW